ncbi:hypothetical protein PoB_004044800 [Plakobranchus ocellatus]|uniref:Uncharacterized protein n=1 Tax=Plakobranchus ocellatus TaxID=259542 RepID=A0AAV4B2Z1_9GAST|nr:hypothetical protein PoB_004044800 [Plakobranchus ocellatus]
MPFLEIYNQSLCTVILFRFAAFCDRLQQSVGRSGTALHGREYELEEVSAGVILLLRVVGVTLSLVPAEVELLRVIAPVAPSSAVTCVELSLAIACGALSLAVALSLFSAD